MVSFPQKMAVFLCLLALCISAHAAEPLVVAGAVYEDRLSLAVRPHFVPVANASIRLYRDGGDRLPGADDLPAGSATTNDVGVYLLRVDQPGEYWVVVDSRSIGSEAAWAEQTFGPAGSLCAHPDGTIRTLPFEGPCFAGRTLANDDPSSLLTAEHLALIPVRERVTGADFAFSFDVVVTTADGEAIQGSLRQFLTNAAARPGPNRMRFVPLQNAPQQREAYYGVPPRWWKIATTASLPVISDADTLLDGTAYNYVSASSVTNTNPGRVGEAATFKPSERVTRRLEKPELELVVAGERGLICEARCGIRSMAIHGASTMVVARADTALEDVMLGASPDALESALPGTVGLHVERGTALARRLLVTSQTTAGIFVGRDGRLDGERLEITRCGTLEGGAAIVLFSDGSSIRSSSITANAGAGIIAGALDGSAPSNGNLIDSSTISANQAGILLAPGSSRNNITRNDLIWNRFGGITLAPHDEKSAPVENRFSANHFDENGLRPIILDLAAEDPNELGGLSRARTEGERQRERLLEARKRKPCEPDPTSPNLGMDTPKITHVRLLRGEATARAVVRGTACPGEIVEIYQSFVTSGIRDDAAEVPRVREEDVRETLTTEERTRALPSIGEFNYLGAVNTSADGSFEAAFPLTVTVPLERETLDEDEREIDIWASDVLRIADPSERAFSAIAIDPSGNTSEMSIRRGIDETDGASAQQPAAKP